MAQTYYAVTPPGLEEPLLRELRKLGARKCVASQGGVTFEGTRKTLYAVMYGTWMAARVYWRVDEFRARDLPELFNKIRRLEWANILPDRCALAIEAVSLRSGLQHTGRIAESTQAAIEESRGKKLALSESDKLVPLKLLVRIEDERCQLSLEAGGWPLYHHGWRTNIGVAPLREAHAATLLSLAGWTPGTPLVDPLCGAGTFALLAARQAAGLPPRTWTSWAFERWAGFEPELWEQTKQDWIAEHPPVEGVIWAADRDPKAIEAAKVNAAQAGVTERVTLSVADVADLLPPCEAPGLIITNPPFGERMSRGGEDQTPADRLLVERFRDHFPGWTLAMLLPSRVTPTFKGLVAEPLGNFRQGGLPVRFWRLSAAA
jgi:putative N6-adenine-specific DNA methylase